MDLIDYILFGFDEGSNICIKNGVRGYHGCWVGTPFPTW